MTEVFGPEAGVFGPEGKFLPEANLVETDKAVEVTVELPGMKPEDVKVEIKENALWITREKKEEKEDKGKGGRKTRSIGISEDQPKLAPQVFLRQLNERETVRSTAQTSGMSFPKSPSQPR